MKKLIFTTVLALLFSAGSVVSAHNPQQEYLGLPGDNFNLFAVMNLFQQSETLEAFERSINDPETMINNLDLNGDGYVDYIMVHDYKEGNIHSIVLRVALNRNEHQDVAVFVVESLRDGSVRIQLIGDKALYGPNYIVEPNYAERANPGYQGNVSQSHTTTVVHTTYYEVAQWPVIVYMHRPAYRPWRSSWYWGYHPAWWSPWSPHYYHYYYGYHYHWHGHYHAYYRPWGHPRCTHYHTVYVVNHRQTSPTVVTRVEQGRYRNTYSQPQKAQEGQQHFAQRHPGRYETVATKSNIATPELRQSSTAVQEIKQTREVSTPNAGTERRQEDAVRQSPEDMRRQSPAENQTRDNRAIQQDNSRQQAQPTRIQGSEASPRQQAQPARSQGSESSPRQQTQPVRSQGSEANPGRETSSPAVRSTPPPARQSTPPPQREVNRPAPERNTSAPPSSPPRVNNSNNRPSAPAVSSPPARTNTQPASSARPSGQSNTRSTPAPTRSNNSNQRGNNSNENDNRSERR
ncbi:MAG: hypothetical protein EA361_05480 [Bacteroidetes bacterium]|nr:MAG: hypothetical protein EA361_05480 [Bacteroidota bacterium]